MTTHCLLKRISEILAPDNSQNFNDFLLKTIEDRGLFLRSRFYKRDNVLKDEECGEITTVLVALNQKWDFNSTDYFETPKGKNPITKLRLQISLLDLSDEESLNREVRRCIAIGFSYPIKIDLEKGIYKVLQL